MPYSIKREKFLDLFNSMNPNRMKYQGPLILRMFGLLNELQLRNENRYILCNFIDQNSDLFGLEDDIYEINHDITLNQLFLYAFSKAKVNNLIGNLFNEYINSVNAISSKIDINIH
jgi:hypothetical protein